jgi:hypothetical protein
MLISLRNKKQVNIKTLVSQKFLVIAFNMSNHCRLLTPRRYPSSYPRASAPTTSKRAPRFQPHIVVVIKLRHKHDDRSFVNPALVES